MTTLPHNPVTPMPVADVATLPNAPVIEEDIQQLQFRGSRRVGLGARTEKPQLSEREPTDKNKAAVDGCIRTGAVMNALFPDGLNLRTQDEFAIYRLFDRMVGDITHFAQSGLTGSASLRDLSLHAMLLESVLAAQDKT